VTSRTKFKRQVFLCPSSFFLSPGFFFFLLWFCFFFFFFCRVFSFFYSFVFRFGVCLSFFFFFFSVDWTISGPSLFLGGFLDDLPRWFFDRLGVFLGVVLFWFVLDHPVPTIILFSPDLVFSLDLIFWRDFFHSGLRLRHSNPCCVRRSSSPPSCRQSSLGLCSSALLLVPRGRRDDDLLFSFNGPSWMGPLWTVPLLRGSR